jgi:hypothetical protein
MSLLRWALSIVWDKCNIYIYIYRYIYVSEAESCPETPWLLWNPQVHYRHHKTPSMDAILSQMHPIHIITLHSLRYTLVLSLHLCLDFPSGIFPSYSPINILYVFLFLLCVLHVPLMHFRYVGKVRLYLCTDITAWRRIQPRRKGKDPPSILWTCSCVGSSACHDVTVKRH